MARITSLMLRCFLYIFLALLGVIGLREIPKSSYTMRDLGSPASSLTTVRPTNGTCKSMVEIYGYKCEEHTVTTKDGYILGLQRIPNGLSGSHTRGKKIPVLLQHGIVVDGSTWVMNPPDEALGFILADNGYDVWITNTRGTIYSRGHTSLSINDSAYWNWSWDELVAYDLPATFEYVYKMSAHQKLHYVGHSMGTLMVLASFSQGKLLSMVKSVALLCPIVYMDHVSSPLVQALTDIFLAEVTYWLGLAEFDPNEVLKTFCKQPHTDCGDLLTFITGQNCCINSSTSQLFLKHEPQPTSTKNMVHLSQMIRRGNIRRYDYNNIAENMKHYGQPIPPAYNLSRIPRDLPLFLSYGGRDSISDVRDVKSLLSRLRSNNCSNLEICYQDNYAHGDFVVGTNASRAIYEPLMRFFRLN